MRALSSQDILDVWECGRRQHPLERALTILTTAFPEMPRPVLARLGIGRRDARLLDVHEGTFGKTLQAVTFCPKCSERLEFDLPLAELNGASPSDGAEQISLSVADITLRCRLPDSYDLAAIASVRDADEAVQQITHRCVLEATRNGVPLDSGSLPVEAIEALSAGLQSADSQAETLFNLQCPACHERWESMLEITDFLWSKIAAQAKRLFSEVNALAGAYGWSERDILALSAARRQRYLEMVGG